MIRGRCPTCGKSFEVATLGDLPSFPFCTARCRLVDLGRWIDGAFVLPGPSRPAPTQVPEAEDDGDE